MKTHEYADLFPMLSDAELKSLSADIAENGLQAPITTYEGKILDGRNRYRACEMAGVDPTLEEYKGADPLAFVVSHNLIRRHLDEGQRGMVGARIATLKHGTNRFLKVETSPDVSTTTITAAAEMMNVGKATIDRAKAVIANGEPGLVEMVEAGELPVRTAYTLSKLPAPEQQAAISKGPAAVKAAVKEFREPEQDQAAPPAKRRLPNYIPDSARDIWTIARSTLDRIDRVDKSLVPVMNEIILYCQRRIENKK